MIQFHKLRANALYELKILLRGWFFRIFAGLSLVFFIAFNIVFFSGAVPIGRLVSGFSASIPYTNMLMLNVAQVAILIFMASDFFKRDRKFNTSEVFYIRSMTNGAYVLGKSLGIFILFLALDVIVLGIAAIIHLVFSETTFNWLPYMLYPMLMGFPTYIFMIGLSFLLMRLIKNQAVVVLILLGYYGAILFYMSDKWHYLFDFLAIQIPLVSSDFVGLVDVKQILLQRGFYFFAGMVFLMFAILFFHRLPQSRKIRRIMIMFTLLCGFLSVLCVNIYVQIFAGQEDLRNRMIHLNQEYQDQANITPHYCRLDIFHHGNELQGKVMYSVSNETTSPLKRFYFSINPGLEVTGVWYQEKSVLFEQKNHILDVKIEDPLQVGGVDSLTIHYEGRIEEEACFTDIDELQRNSSFTYWLFQIPKKYVFLSKDYVLLSPECLWYPRVGLPPGTGFPDKMQKNFIQYELSVHTRPNLTAISQGAVEVLAAGQFIFKPEFPLEHISLLIGSYNKQSITVDSVDYILYTMPEHSYYKKYFTDIGDTIGEIIKESRQDYEVRLNLEYPFKRLSLVEVPIQYYVYPRIWTLAQEVVQPEQVWIQENAAFLASADFKWSTRSMERRLDRSNQTLTEVETQVTLLKNFLNNTFYGRPYRRFGVGGPPVEYRPDYNLFANYYSHVINLRSKDWEILNLAIQAYLYDRVRSSQEEIPQWFMEGLTKAEEVCQALQTKSLAEHLESDENNALLTAMIREKGAFILKLLQNEVGSRKFEENLIKVLQENRFKNIDLQTFKEALNLDPKFDLEAYLENWYYSKDLPAFRLSNVDLYKVMDKDRIRSQIIFTINNPEHIEGLIEVVFRYMRRGRGMPFGPSDSEEPPRLYYLAAQQTKEIGILLDEEPSAININCLIAQNLPLIFSKRFEDAELHEKSTPFHGEKYLKEMPLLVQPGEVIVDNEDKGFEAFNPPFTSILKQMIHGGQTEDKQEKYGRLQWWRPPAHWTLIKNATFFGKYIHSAYYIGSGDGSKYVTWRAQIPENGFYDIYAYMFNTEGLWRGRGNRRNVTFGDFNYQIFHDGGEDEITLVADDAQEGWNFLGSWYFSAGETKVQLSDASNGRVIIADALKWVKN